MSKFLAKAEKRRLTQGSYEDHIRSVGFLIGEAELVSTYAGYAIVRKDEGYYKILFARDDSGILRVLGEEKLEVKQYDSMQVGELAKDLALEFVDLFLKGSTNRMTSRLLEVSQYVDCSECEKVDVIQAMLAAPRFWKRLMTDREEGIKRIISDKLESLVEIRLQPKFEKLYDKNSDAPEEVPASEVSKELSLVVERVRELEKAVQNSVEVVASGRKTVQDEENEQIFMRLDEFTADLLTDLKVLLEKVAKVEIKSVPCLARLRDILAEGLNFYEVANCFISTVADRLLEGSKTS